MVKRPSVEMLNAVWDWYRQNPTVYRKIVYFHCEIMLHDYYVGKVVYK